MFLEKMGVDTEKLSIPLRMKRKYIVRGERKSIQVTFNSFEDETLYLLVELLLKIQLSIPLRMKPHLPKFTKFMKYLSIPLRMKQRRK